MISYEEKKSNENLYRSEIVDIQAEIIELLKENLSELKPKDQGKLIGLEKILNNYTSKLNELVNLSDDEIDWTK